MVERGGAFRDSDYYELFHEHMNLQARFKAATGFMVAVLRARKDAAR